MSGFSDERESPPKDISSLQQAVQESPYSIPARLSLARRFSELGYPDLATGEAYLVLLLADEVLEDYNEYHEEAYQTAVAGTPESRYPDESDETAVRRWVEGELGRAYVRPSCS